MRRVSVWRDLGLTADRAKPFRARLGPWWFYAAMCALLLGTFGWMMTGIGFEHPGAAKDIALFVVLPLTLVGGAQAVIAWRYQQHH